MQFRPSKPGVSRLLLLIILFAACKVNPEAERKRTLKNLFSRHLFDNTLNNEKEWKINTDKLERIEITNGRHTGISLNAAVDSLYYIKLETINDCLIGRIDKIYEGNGKIVIVDKDFAKEIFIFNTEGKFLSKVSHLGEGPQQYKLITDAAVDFTKEEVLILDRSTRKMVSYSFDGTFKERTSLPFFIDFFEYLKGDTAMIWSNRNYLNSHIPAIESFSLFMARPQGKVIQRSFPFDPKKTGEGFNYWNTKMLSKFGEHIYFNPRLSDYIFRIDPDNIEAAFYLDFKGRSFSTEEANNLTNAVYEKHMNENDFFLFNGDFAINDEYVYCKIVNKVKYFGCFYSRKQKISACFSNINVDHPDAVLFNFPYTGSREFFITALDAPDIVGTKEKLKVLKKSPYVVDLFNSVQPDDNPVLMYYSFK